MSGDEEIVLDEHLGANDSVLYYDDALNTPTPFQVVVQGFLLTGIGCLGLVGNALSLYIFSRPQMMCSINILLMGVVCSDTVLILTSMSMFSLPVFRRWLWLSHSYYFFVYPYVLPLVYPVGMVAQTGSAYMTLGVTIERYLAVCRPLSARSICTNRRAKNAVAAFAAFAVIYNIPRFLEISWSPTYVAELERIVDFYVITKLRLDSRYEHVYVHWMYLVFMYVVPFASLAAFNARIFVAVRAANVARSTLSHQQRKEHNLAIMLLAVVAMFFVCNLLPLVVNVLEVFFEITYMPLTHLSNLLVTINSSLNIVIYCTFAKRFRRIFVQTLCPGHAASTPALQLYRTNMTTHRFSHGDLGRKDALEHSVSPSMAF